LLGRASFCGVKKKNAVVFPHAIFWSIWHEGNRGVFECVEMPLQQFKK